MIDTRKLKELVRLMVENELSELDLRDKDETVTIKRGGGEAPVVHVAPAASNGSVSAPAPAPAPSAPEAPEAPAADDGLVAIESPMVGTFYSKPNPDADVYVTPGASVSPGSVVCIVEAMKVFNEIKSEVAGSVERILVQDGDAVEFGQKLFLVRPA